MRFNQFSAMSNNPHSFEGGIDERANEAQAERDKLALPSRNSPKTSITSRRSTAHLRRVTRRYLYFAFIITSTCLYLVGETIGPDVSNARISANPAPAVEFPNPLAESAAPMRRNYQDLTLAKGSSVIETLGSIKVPTAEALAALESLKPYFDLRRLKPGQTLRVFWESPADALALEAKPEAFQRFAGLDIIPTPRTHLSVRRNSTQSWLAQSQERELKDRQFFANALIKTSVYEAARANGLAPNLVVKLIRLFSYSVDFQRDIREGDQLEVLYSRRFDNNGDVAEEGDVMYAALTNQGKRIAIWAMPKDNGELVYYGPDGTSIQRLLMKTPVDGARLSSQFGMRRHPILGYTKLHKGLDFAAPRGTPIYAAGDGVIIQKGRSRANGNYLRLRHKNGYETAYLHMNNFAAGIRKGKRVSQGQVIGGVGSTGLATGPHLHYEVVLRGKPINPRTLDLPPSIALNDTGRKRLASVQKEIEAQIRALTSGNQFASSR